MLFRSNSPMKCSANHVMALITGLSPICDYRNLLKNALLHKSLGNERKEYKNQNNERLELLGDAVLDLIVAEYLYKSYKNASEGTIAKLKAMPVEKG